MRTTSRSRAPRAVLFGALGVLFAALSLFFVYYTARLVYINVAGLAGERQRGMYIGAIAFPIAALIFGWVSLRCFRLILGKIPPTAAR